MIVRPVDSDGVVADQLHILNGYIQRNRIAIEYPHSGVLIDAGRAVAFTTQRAKCVLTCPVRAPNDGQRASGTVGFDILWSD